MASLATPNQAPRVSPPNADQARLSREGRNLMIGLLVVFFGLMLVANGAVLWFATQNAPDVEQSYKNEKR